MSDTFSSNSELILMSYDILRTLTMQIVVQALVLSNNTGISFLNMDFIDIMLESLTSFKRAGCDGILTYGACEIA